MLTTTTKKQTLYINKSKLKKAVISLLKILSIVCGVCGFLWILGTAGASDNNIISFNQILIQITKGGIFCGISYILNSIKNTLQ